MVAISVDASDIHRFAQRCLAAGPIIERHYEAAMVRSTAAVQHDAMVAVPVDTGHLRRSITTNVTPFVGSVGTNLSYARIVEGVDENGNPREWSRRPDQPPPPRGVLLDWMRRHGIPEGAETALRFSIAKKGIKARPYLIPALERNRDGIEREFALAADRAIAEVLA